MQMQVRNELNPLGYFSLRRSLLMFSILALFGGLALPMMAAPSTSKPDEVWRKTLDDVAKGDFADAARDSHQIPDGGLVSQVQAWLDNYIEKQKARAELNKVDFEKYVTYAKQRIERKEYAMALDKALLASDEAPSKDEFLHADWMQKLVNDSLKKAEELRGESKWREAWHIYADLAGLYEREPRYQKLEHEVLTHLRLESMFGDEKSNWKERIERVQWKDAEAALECIGLYYVEPPDFKAITERGLEQLLILADSPAAQKTFETLKNNDDRDDFVNRIKANLEQVRTAPSVDRRTSVERFRRAVQVINRETVKLPEELVVSELMRGALEPLDDFTTMIWPKETEEFDKHTRGDFIGVGISIIKNKMNEIEVVTPLEDTPAFRHGIQAGDIIIKVDATEIKDYSLNKVVDTITGVAGTPVTLMIRRNDKEIEFPLVRERVKIQSVKGWARKPDGSWNHWLDESNHVGYIRVTNFQRNTVEDLTNVMSDLESHGLKGLVLDLRWNPGGLLDSAYQMSSLFLKRSENVVSTKGRNSSEDQRLDVTSNGPYASVPMVVLVNESSASASEIVSGALRDNHRATVIGERTFGKFSVQNLIPLTSSQAKLKITTARYYIPSGVSLHREPTSEKWGVEPEIALKLVRWESFNAYQLRRDADLLGPPKPDATAKKDKEDDTVDLSTIDPITGETIKPKKDDKESGKSADGAKKDDAKDADKTTDGAKKEGAKGTDGEKVADGEDKLPELKQPDENNRPKEDPQVDTALLLMRMKLLGLNHPTLATAEKVENLESAKP